jgi:hypothetical protein
VKASIVYISEGVSLSVERQIFRTKASPSGMRARMGTNVRARMSASASADVRVSMNARAGDRLTARTKAGMG